MFESYKLVDGEYVKQVILESEKDVEQLYHAIKNGTYHWDD
jgi:anti-sigma28 factor (negative regulator of flagellin synthesis)